MNDEIRKTLDRDGCCILRRIWSPSEVATATTLVRTATAGGLHNSGVRVLHPRDLDPCLYGMLTGGALARAVVGALGACEFLSAKPVVKDARYAFATPWHQDRPYWGGCVKWSVWIALERVDPGNGCLRIVRGSHLRELPHHAPPDDRSGFANRLTVDESLAEDMPLEPGDAVLFHDLLLHASHPCATGRARTALIPTYRSLGAQDASAVWSDPRPLEAA